MSKLTLALIFLVWLAFLFFAGNWGHPSANRHLGSVSVNEAQPRYYWTGVECRSIDYDSLVDPRRCNSRTVCVEQPNGLAFSAGELFNDGSSSLIISFDSVLVKNGSVRSIVGYTKNATPGMLYPSYPSMPLQDLFATYGQAAIRFLVNKGRDLPNNVTLPGAYFVVSKDNNDILFEVELQSRHRFRYRFVQGNYKFIENSKYLHELFKGYWTQNSTNDDSKWFSLIIQIAESYKKECEELFRVKKSRR